MAQGTHLWTQSRFEEFEKGTPSGVAITSDGKLRRGPAALDLLTTPSTFVWSIATDVKNPGVAYLATGSPAAVLRVHLDQKVASEPSSNDRFDKLFESKALAVQVLRMGPDGALYAATIPDGKVYRLNPAASGSLDEGKAQVVFDLAKAEEAAAKRIDRGPEGGSSGTTDAKKNDSKARYIWDMTFDSSGRLYIATGGPGAVYRLDVTKPNAEAELFFKSDEQHIRALAWDRAGKDGKANLIAGSDGSGLVYRISPEGRGYVLFSAPRREVTALAVGADGTIFESDVGDKSHSPLPQIPVQGGSSSITISFVSPGSVQAANASTALPEGSEIFAIAADQAPRKLWSGKDEVVYALTTGADGLTALTGNRGRILTIHPDGSFADIAHLEAQQAVTMTQTSGGWLIGTANTGKLYRLTEAKDPTLSGKSDAREKAHLADEHAYASDVLDAGASARWGRVEVNPESHGYEIWTRSGNVEQPVRSAKDWGWSDWQPLNAGKVASPPGRYLQWKAMLEPDGVVSGVGINFLAINAAPQVDDVLVVPGAKFVPQPPSTQVPTVTIAFPAGGQSGGIVLDTGGGNASIPIQAQKDKTSVTVRWNAHDDNGDEMSYDLFLQGDGEHGWRPLKKGLTEKVYSFDGASLPDGGYQIRVVASDAPSHTPGDALTGELTSERFELDTTPPTILDLKAGAMQKIDSGKAGGDSQIATCTDEPCAPLFRIPLSFEAKDATSPISHAEYSIDSGKWQFIEPIGELSDAKEERYAVDVPVPASVAAADEKAVDVKAQPLTAEHLITVRVYDRHENVATAKVLVSAPEPKNGRPEKP